MPLHRGMICQFQVRWVFYYNCSESTGKKTNKTHLCALCRQKIWLLCRILKVNLIWPLNENSLRLSEKNFSTKETLSFFFWLKHNRILKLNSVKSEILKLYNDQLVIFYLVTNLVPLTLEMFLQNRGAGESGNAGISYMASRLLLYLLSCFLSLRLSFSAYWTPSPVFYTVGL